MADESTKADDVRKLKLTLLNFKEVAPKNLPEGLPPGSALRQNLEWFESYIARIESGN